jgi:hypothetical protein
MDDQPTMRSGLWRATRHATGWVLGAGGVVVAGTLLRGGPRHAVKAAMKAGMRGREVAAELAEQMQDLHAEAQSERATGSGEARH